MHVRIVRLDSGDFEVTTPSRRVVVNEVHIDGSTLRDYITDVELEALAVTVLTVRRGSVDTTACVIATIRSVFEEKLGELRRLERAVRRLEEVADTLSIVALVKPEKEEGEGEEEVDGRRGGAPQGPEPLRMTF
jgi:hypothetical protein